MATSPPFVLVDKKDCIVTMRPESEDTDGMECETRSASSSEPKIPKLHSGLPPGSYHPFTQMQEPVPSLPRPSQAASPSPPGPLQENTGAPEPTDPASAGESRSQAVGASPVCDPLNVVGKPEGVGGEEDREYSVLIIGKTGNGKSSLANTLTGARSFPVGRGLLITTKEAQQVTVDVVDRRLRVIDTPDFTNLTSESMTADQHVLQWKQLTSSRPDVIILAVRCDVRYTKEEFDIYQEIQETWNDLSVFCQRLMVAFTFGDMQDEELEEELKSVNEELKRVLRDAHNRFVQVNNKAKGEEKAKQQEAIHRALDKVIRQNEKQARAAQMKAETPEDFAVLLVGQSGHGKSSVGNLLTGKRSFAVGQGLLTVTTEPSYDTVDVPGKRIKVIDTPALEDSDTARTRQMESWKRMTSQHPVVILFVVRCDVRFTPDEAALYREVKALWGKTPPRSDPRVVVVFTFKDRLDPGLQADGGFEEQVKKHPAVKGLLTEAGQRWVAVNSAASADSNREAVSRLLSYLGAQAQGMKAYQQLFTTGVAGNRGVTSEVTSANRQCEERPHGYLLPTTEESSESDSWCQLI